jgi:hypothetical protein
LAAGEAAGSVIAALAATANAATAAPAAAIEIFTRCGLFRAIQS